MVCRNNQLLLLLRVKRTLLATSALQMHTILWCELRRRNYRRSWNKLLDTLNKECVEGESVDAKTWW